MSGRTLNGGMVICAGPYKVETTSGLVLNVDSPIRREMADVLVQVIESEGLSTSEVMAVEFRGEGKPIITSINEEYQRRQVAAMRGAA